jgi:hypothetical protein
MNRSVYTAMPFLKIKRKQQVKKLQIVWTIPVMILNLKNAKSKESAEITSLPLQVFNFCWFVRRAKVLNNPQKT